MKLEFGPNFRDKILLHLLSMGAVVETILAELTTPITIGRAFQSLETQEFFRRRRTSSRSTLSYLLARKFILGRGSRGRKEFQLTEEGLDYLFAKFPSLKCQNRPWDGLWRVVIYDVPEKESRLRDRLRYELRRLGYRFMQKSVWLTPWAVEEELEAFLKKEKLWGKVLVMKAWLPPRESQRLAKHFQSLSLTAGFFPSWAPSPPAASR